MKTAKIVFLFICTALLCACSVQTNFDIYDLCERYNSLADEKILSTSDFVSDSNGTLYAFFNVGESQLLVSVDTDKSDAIKGIRITSESSLYDKNDEEIIREFVTRFFAAFDYKNTDEAKKNLSAVGFDKFKPFDEKYECEKIGRFDYVLYSNEYSFTVSAQKISADEL